MKTSAITVVAACAFLGVLSMQASASIVLVAPPHGDMKAKQQGAADATTSCSRELQGLGLRPDRNTREPSLRHASSEERDASAQAHECAQRRWLIPANDLTVMRTR